MSLHRLPVPAGNARGFLTAVWCASMKTPYTKAVRHCCHAHHLPKDIGDNFGAHGESRTVSSAGGAPPSTSRPLALFRFHLEQLPPQLQREFDVHANQRALRHLWHPKRAGAQSDESSAAMLDLPLTPSTAHPVLWRCTRCRAQWSARPSERTNPQLADAHRCPQCYGGNCLSSDTPNVPKPTPPPAQPELSSSPTAPSAGTSLLCDAYPLLAAQWDCRRNGLLQNQVLQSVTEVRTSSASAVWWCCPLCCSAWLESVCSRVARYALAMQRHSAPAKCDPQEGSTTLGGSSNLPSHEAVPLCPSCERRNVSAGSGITPAGPRRWLADDKLLLGEALLRPHQDPQQISLASEMTLQWRCRNCQFEYTSTVANRFLRHERCPQCSGKKKTLLNLLVVQRPDVVKEVSKHISRTRLSFITVHDDVELPFVCRTCYAPYRMTARARCAVPRGVPACSKCFLTSSRVLTEAQQQQGAKALSARARRRVRQKALQLSRSDRNWERLAATANELSHRDNALKD